MDVYPIQPELVLAIAVAAAFVLGLMTHRLARSMRYKQTINDLTEQLEQLDQQRDAAHRVSLDLAASHTKLIGEHQEAEWMIRSLKADLRLREAKIEKLSGDLVSELPSVNDDMWITESEFAVGTGSS